MQMVGGTEEVRWRQMNRCGDTKGSSQNKKKAYTAYKHVGYFLFLKNKCSFFPFLLSR